MPDDTEDRAPEAVSGNVAEIKQEIEATEAQIETAEAEGAPQSAIVGAEARLEALEQRLADLERGHGELGVRIDGRAPAEHSHALPGHVQTISDALAEMEAEEHPPVRAKWYERRLFGRRD